MGGRSSSRSLIGMMSALLVAGLSPPAAAATTVTIDGVSRNDSFVTVTGRATYANQAPVMLGTDPAGDAPVPGAEYAGKDVTAFSMATARDGSVTLRWHLSQLPPGLDRGVDVAYGKAFCVTPSDEPNCWVIIFADIAGAPLTNSFVQAWRCPDETCAIGSGDWIHTWETDAYLVAEKIALVTVPATDLGIEPGSTLAGVRSPNWSSSVFVTTPWWFLSTSGAYPAYERTAIDADYAVPQKTVSLAIGSPGQDPEGADYTTVATEDEFGRYTGSLDVSHLTPGTYEVYVRACFGDDNCGFTSKEVTL